MVLACSSAACASRSHSNKCSFIFSMVISLRAAQPLRLVSYGSVRQTGADDQNGNVQAELYIPFVLLLLRKLSRAAWLLPTEDEAAARGYAIVDGVACPAADFLFGHHAPTTRCCLSTSSYSMPSWTLSLTSQSK